MKKFGIGLAILVLVLYLADAIYPTWDVDCAIDRSGIFPMAPSVPEFREDPTVRVMSPTPTKGCKLTPNNKARHVFQAVSGVVGFFSKTPK